MRSRSAATAFGSRSSRRTQVAPDVGQPLRAGCGDEAGVDEVAQVLADVGPRRLQRRGGQRLAASRLGTSCARRLPECRTRCHETRPGSHSHRQRCGPRAGPGRADPPSELWSRSPNRRHLGGGEGGSCGPSRKRARGLAAVRSAALAGARASARRLGTSEPERGADICPVSTVCARTCCCTACRAVADLPHRRAAAGRRRHRRVVSLCRRQARPASNPERLRMTLAEWTLPRQRTA
jgi:hypothetical protein